MKKTFERLRLFHRFETIGMPPGTIVSSGESRSETVRITVFDYDESGFEEHEFKAIEECYDFRDKSTVTWINIDGIHDAALIEKIDAHFGIHPLVLEDVVQTGQRPKFEDFGDYLFIVMKMIYCLKDKDDADAEQVSLLVGHNYVISFQEKPGDVFEVIRSRIRSGKGRIRKMGADYLAYCLLDAVVDNYFLVLENFDQRIADIEDRISGTEGQEVAREIHGVKRNLIFLKKQVWPLRDVISLMLRTESKLIKKTTGVYLRDIYDHTVQVVDTVESFREMISGVHDVYLSMMSNRMNEVMKILTMFAAIFIPLTFIAGIYGMNFKFMPELEWHWGYFTVLGVMAMLLVGMILYFKKKHWF